jgi:hypothetical protein
VLGAFSVAAVPAGIAASHYLREVKLLEALIVSAPAAVVLALSSIVVRRVARRRIRRSIAPNERPLRLGKWLGWLGLYLGLMAALALGFYGILRLYD